MTSNANPSVGVAVGGIGTFKYFAVYTTTTPSGKKVVLTEPCGERFGSNAGIADSNQRNLMALRTLLTVDRRLQMLRECLPGVHTVLIGNQGPMSEETLEIMRREAAVNNIEPVFPP